MVFVLVVIALAAMSRLGWFGDWERHFYASPEPVYEGRQQQRRAVREIASRAVGGAPIDRRTRRQAASEIARSLKR